MKIFVAIPAYNGSLHMESIRCLLNEQTAASVLGDEISFAFLGGNDGIIVGRNQLATEFLKSDCDKMVFLDADVTFGLGSLLKLVRYPFDFVGGCYRYKMAEEKYPIAWLDKPELQANEFGLLEVAMLPAGFLSLSRNVLETIRKNHPEREYEHLGKRGFAYFSMPIVNGNLYGEDNNLCREWRECEGKIYLDPEVELTHWSFNPTPHVGHIGNWLKNRLKEQSNVAQRIPQMEASPI